MAENRRTFQFSLVRLKIFLRLFIFRDIACEDSQDLTNDWQEDQKLPWSRSEVDKKQKLENVVKPDPVNYFVA